MPVQRGSVVRYRGPSREKGIVLLAFGDKAVVCVFPKRDKRKPFIANYGTPMLEVIGTTKNVPPACMETLVKTHEKAFEKAQKPKKRRR